MNKGEIKKTTSLNAIKSNTGKRNRSRKKDIRKKAKKKMKGWWK